MAVKLLPVVNGAPFVDSNGDPLSGGKIYTYTAGSSTPETTYTTSVGDVAHANPIILGSGGYPSSGGSVVGVFGTSGVSYKLVLKTSADVTVWTRDGIEGINDTVVSQSEWTSGPAPTYISATSLSLVGDQTSTFHVGRRLKTTNSGGTIYSTISATAYTSLTTVTVLNDSGVLDSGLSAVSYGLISAVETSSPAITSGIPQNSKSAAYTTVLADANKHILHPAADNNARTFTIDANGTVAYPVGTCLTFVNEINVLTIAITTDTLALAGTASTGSRTLAAMGIATALKKTTTSWLISGVGLT